MLPNLLGLIGLILVAVFFIWLLVRAVRARALAVKILGGLFAGLLALVFVAASLLVGLGMVHLFLPRQVPSASVTVQGSPEQVSRGEHIATVLCSSCHSDNEHTPLTGSHSNFLAGIPMPLGTMYAANLTPGGEVKNWSDADLFRAMRYNVRPDGMPLFMPAQGVHKMSDEDTLAVIAYLRSQQAVDYQPSRPQPSLLLLAMNGAGVLQIVAPNNTQPVAAQAAGPTAEYGHYLVDVLSCSDCHGANLSGGKPPAPVGPNLRVVKGWTAQQFMTTLRTGTDPGGHQLSTEMPWKFFGSRLSDDELTAIYNYLHGL